MATLQGGRFVPRAFAEIMGPGLVASALVPWT
jgi:hypothetical protein